MESSIAHLNTYRQSPRKVRLLADLVRGQKVSLAVTTLRFASKRASMPIIKLIESAVANAKNKGLNTDLLIVDKITVNAGEILHRSMPMSRGRAFRIKKRTSRVSVSLVEKAEKVKKTKNTTSENKAKVGKLKKSSLVKSEK